MSAELFTPQCLSCGYDLSGLPDGRCPECGAAFTHEGLFRRATEKAADLRTVLQGLTSALVVIAYLLAVGMLLSRIDRQSGSDGGLVIIWVIVAMWVAAWFPILRARPQSFVVVVLPTIASLWELWIMFPVDPYRIALGTSVLGLALLVPAARVAPRIVLGALALALACLTAGRGAVLRDAGYDAMFNMHAWTAYADPRPGQMYRQYPLTPDEAIVLGSWMMWVGLALSGVMVGVLTLAWRGIRLEWGRART